MTGTWIPAANLTGIDGSAGTGGRTGSAGPVGPRGVVGEPGPTGPSAINPPCCSVIQLSPIAIASNADTIVPWQLVFFDAAPDGVESMYDAVNSAIIAPWDGFYLVHGVWTWAQDPVGAGQVRQMAILRDSTSYTGGSVLYQQKQRQPWHTEHEVCGLVECRAGAKLRMIVNHEAGQAVNGGGCIWGNIRGRMTVAYRSSKG